MLMKNSFGESVAVTLFGESHGSAVGIVIDGIAPGVEVSEDEINGFLARRRPSVKLDTPRCERDEFRILSGVFENRTTGTPICIVIENENVKSDDYAYGEARPSHADYAAFCKYHGYEDYRGGGHFSGRVTAALVAAGGILIPALEKIGISISTHILRCGGVSDRGFENLPADLALLKDRIPPVFSDEVAEKMNEAVMSARGAGDSVGGITQTAICGLPSGLGEPWFDSVESTISHILFSIGGIKGVEFGIGFGGADLRGSEYNDALRVHDGSIMTETNNNGGINGGITNGMPVVFQCAVKPTPSISLEQKTVDFIKKENANITVHGRHDPAIIRRICPVIDSVTAIAVCDMLAKRYGTDYIVNKGRLTDESDN